VSGYVDLHCHLLWGVDDGAKTLEDSLEMASALVDLGFARVAASPHNRPQYAPRALALERLTHVRQALSDAGIPLVLEENAENFFQDEGLLGVLGTPDARMIGRGPFMLIEAPYTAPLPALTEIIFRMKLKGVTPLIAHPERCLEFERPGRAAEAVHAGAFLQLDVGALVGRYGPRAKKVAQELLDEDLYAVGATDLHSPVGAREWVAKSLRELENRMGGETLARLMRESPERIASGIGLES
jgi:protein-tyrosine phosphatase